VGGIQDLVAQELLPTAQLDATFPSPNGYESYASGRESAQLSLLIIRILPLHAARRYKEGPVAVTDRVSDLRSKVAVVRLLVIGTDRDNKIMSPGPP
jgi:hypothetical protein